MRALSFVVAVTGHRDIPEQDIERLKFIVGRELAALSAKIISLKPLLLSGLADGADRLVAEVALASGWQVIGVLPMPVAEYEQDFSDPGSLERFRALLAQCRHRIELPIAASLDSDIPDSHRRDQQYRNLGRFLVRNAQVLLALWDGVSEAAKPGGTAEVVQLATEGVANPVVGGLPAEDAAPVLHVLTRRTRAPAAIPEDQIGAVHWRGMLDLQTVSAMQRFESVAKSCPTRNPDAMKDSRRYLIGTNPPAIARSESIDGVVGFYVAADTDAIQAQRQRSVAVKLILAIAATAVLVHELYGGLLSHPAVLALYVLAIAASFGVHRWAFHARHCEDRYLDHRAVAEGLRVAYFWSLAGEPTRVSDHYLLHQSAELGWIRVTLRNICLTVQADSDSRQDAVDLAYIRSQWLEDQRNYFVGKDTLGGKAVVHAAAARHLDRQARWAFWCGIGLALTCLAGHLAGVADVVRDLLFLASTMTIGLAGIFKAIETVNSHEELSLRYRRMGLLYQRALDEFDKSVSTNDPARTRECLRAIGREALAENAEWLLLHRERSFDVPVGS
jgi:hypothetical protein